MRVHSVNLMFGAPQKATSVTVDNVHVVLYCSSVPVQVPVGDEGRSLRHTCTTHCTYVLVFGLTVPTVISVERAVGVNILSPRKEIR